MWLQVPSFPRARPRMRRREVWVAALNLTSIEAHSHTLSNFLTDQTLEASTRKPRGKVNESQKYHQTKIIKCITLIITTVRNPATRSLMSATLTALSAAVGSVTWLPALLCTDEPTLVAGTAVLHALSRLGRAREAGQGCSWLSHLAARARVHRRTDARRLDGRPSALSLRVAAREGPHRC